MTSKDIAEKVLSFWFDGCDQNKFCPKSFWFNSDLKIDNYIKNEFFDFLKIEYNIQEYHPYIRLADIIIRDQFPRHIYRNMKESYIYDIYALELCKNGIYNKIDEKLSIYERCFFYLPLEHDENINSQNQSVKLYNILYNNSPEKYKYFLKEFCKYAEIHQEIIQKFGRFPHRNTILNRESTEEELVYLKKHPNQF
eukprot:GHVL01021477.1.p2 GENE.GHVL01021477.1~~GHVL01021477.1.p2  ORF type:complete len:196 (+),score=51.27 GHVL01021477.1:13-600(+)